MIRWQNSKRRGAIIDDHGAAIIGMDSTAGLDSHERKLNLCHCYLGLTPPEPRFWPLMNSPDTMASSQSQSNLILQHLRYNSTILMASITHCLHAHDLQICSSSVLVVHWTPPCSFHPLLNLPLPWCSPSQERAPPYPKYSVSHLIVLPLILALPHP